MNKKRAVAVFFILSFVFLFIFISSYGSRAATQGQVVASFIDVGQGDSALLRSDDGFDILIDGGKTSAGPTVVAYLREQSVDDIDVMVASHADSDHIGGLIDVLEANDIPVLSVLYNGYPGDTLTWNAFATAVAEEGIVMAPAQFPQEFTWGSLTVHVLNPASGLINPETNDASVVLLIEHGDVRYLFTGDIDASIEATVVARGTSVAAEVLKVAHHGSKFGSSTDFLNEAQPEVAVISVGTNSYGHPAQETLDRLLAAGAQVLRTDQDGTVVISSDGFTYTILLPALDALVVYLPIIIRDFPLPTLTPTPTQSPTPTQTFQEPTPIPPTATPTPTATQSSGNTGDIVITNIFADGAGSSEPDEYVEIKNNDSITIQLQGWTVRDEASHIFTFPSYLIAPGQVCRVYTNENHPEWCGFNYGSGSAIWNNSGDTAYLYDSNGSMIDSYSY